MELRKDVHNWLSDSARPTLLVNIFHSVEQKGMPVSTRGKKFHHCSSPSWWMLFQEKRDIETERKKKQEGGRRETERLGLP